MAGPVVTRFAPSPTGFLHIGGARTALFNWAFARANGGKFLLRIEDTDKERSSGEAIEAIFEGLAWLGLNADEDPVYQSSREERHVEVVDELLKSGHAYVSHATPEEINEIRSSARAKGIAASYPGRDETSLPADRNGGVVRFKAPLSGKTLIEDAVQGSVSIRNDQLDDLVLLRSDGSPTYMLAVVVDDHDMNITHVIRGDDHLTNAARQAQIYKALGWAQPIFAHIPLIHGADGAKLSKRHGALGAETYRDMGYLSDAMLNYLVRLGWSHGDDEIIPRAKIIEWFTLEAINKAPARFDISKLQSLNSHYIKEIDEDALIDELKYLVDRQFDRFELSVAREAIDFNRLKKALPSLRGRAKTLIDLLKDGEYLFREIPFELDEKAEKQLGNEDAKSILSEVSILLEGASQWGLEEIETILKGYAEEKSIKFGKIAPPLRAVLTGTTVSPGIYDVLYSLGKDESLARINDKISS